MSKTSPNDALGSSSPKPSYAATVRSAWTYAIHVALFLLIMSLAVTLGASMGVEPDRRAVSVAMGTLEPAIASLVMLILAFVYPAVYAGTTMRFPHTVTLPVVFTTVLAVVHLFGLATPTKLQRFDGIARLDQLWGQPMVLILLALTQSVILTLYAAHRNRPRQETSA